MEENHQDYIFDIKKQILKEESSLKESSQSLAKLQQLEDKNKITSKQNPSWNCYDQKIYLKS